MMECDLLKLIKDRIPSLEENKAVCKLLDYYLNDSYSSDYSIIKEDRIVMDNGTSVIFDGGNNIRVVKTNQDMNVEEDVRFNIVDNNSFNMSYCNYASNEGKPTIKSFNLTFCNNKLIKAVISEWDFSKEMEMLVYTIADLLDVTVPNIDYYQEVSQLIEEYADENIISHYKILNVLDNKVITDEDGMLLEEDLVKDKVDELDDFFDFSKQENNKTKRAMYDSLLTVENVNTSKGRQYILLNNKK